MQAQRPLTGSGYGQYQPQNPPRVNQQAPLARSPYSDPKYQLRNNNYPTLPQQNYNMQPYNYQAPMNTSQAQFIPPAQQPTMNYIPPPPNVSSFVIGDSMKHKMCSLYTFLDKINFISQMMVNGIIKKEESNELLKDPMQRLSTLSGGIRQGYKMLPQQEIFDFANITNLDVSYAKTELFPNVSSNQPSESQKMTAGIQLGQRHTEFCDKIALSRKELPLKQQDVNYLNQLLYDLKFLAQTLHPNDEQLMSIITSIINSMKRATEMNEQQLIDLQGRVGYFVQLCKSK